MLYSIKKKKPLANLGNKRTNEMRFLSHFFWVFRTHEALLSPTMYIASGLMPHPAGKKTNHVSTLQKLRVPWERHMHEITLMEDRPW